MLDLNTVVARGKNWKIPFFWAPVLKYISAPILAIIVAFAYPDFHEVRNDPLNIFAFAVAHLTMLAVTVGLIFPRALRQIVPAERAATAGKLGDYDSSDLAPAVTGYSVEDRMEHGVEKMHST